MKQSFPLRQPVRVLDTGLDLPADYADKLAEMFWAQVSKKRRIRAPRERAMRALNALFLKDGVLDIPDQRSMPNGELLELANRWLEDNEEKPVKPDTLLRVAGRRRR